MSNGYSAIVTSNAWTALRWGLAFLRSGDNICADLIHKVVRASAIDRFPTREGGGVVGSGHSVFGFRAIFAGGGVVCVDA